MPLSLVAWELKWVSLAGMNGILEVAGGEGDSGVDGGGEENCKAQQQWVTAPALPASGGLEKDSPLMVGHSSTDKAFVAPDGLTEAAH